MFARMATKSATAARIAEVTGNSPVTEEKRIRNLAPKHIPHSRKGREGVGSVQMRPFHLLCCALARAGDQPADASSTVEKLLPLIVVADTVTAPPGVQLDYDILPLSADEHEKTLAEWGAEFINKLHRLEYHAQIRSDYGASWRLDLCLDPPEAVHSFTAPDQAVHTTRFAPPVPAEPPPTARERRWVSLPLEFFLTLGEIWADSIAKISAGKTADTEIAEEDTEDAV